MGVLEEWRMRDVETKAERANSRLYEIDALRSEVHSLEHSMRQARSDIDGLRSIISTLQDQIIIQLQRDIEQLQNAEKP